MDSVITIKGVTKSYSDGWGNFDEPALKPLDLEIQKGEIVGIFGGNGSGKSTLVKMICGLLKPTSGQLLVNDMDPEKAAASGGMGYVQEKTSLPEYLTVEAYLKWLGKLSGFKGEFLQKRVSYSMDQLGLLPNAAKKIGKLSKGAMQRLSIAQSLLHDPAIYLFDEPTDGLDPLALERVLELFVKLKQEGKTLLISSHYFSGMEELCSRVLILNEGMAVFSGKPDFPQGMRKWLIDHLKQHEAGKVDN